MQDHSLGSCTEGARISTGDQPVAHHNYALTLDWWQGRQGQEAQLELNRTRGQLSALEAALEEARQVQCPLLAAAFCGMLQTLVNQFPYNSFDVPNTRTPIYVSVWSTLQAERAALDKADASSTRQGRTEGGDGGSTNVHQTDFEMSSTENQYQSRLEEERQKRLQAEQVCASERQHFFSTMQNMEGRLMQLQLERSHNSHSIGHSMVDNSLSVKAIQPHLPYHGPVVRVPAPHSPTSPHY